MDPLSVLTFVFGEQWPFFATAGVLYVAGKASKSLFGRHRAGRLWSAFHSTMAYHPVVAGFAIGLVPGAPAPANVSALGWLAAPIYFAASGALASSGVKLYRAWSASRGSP